MSLFSMPTGGASAGSPGQSSTSSPGGAGQQQPLQPIIPAPIPPSGGPVTLPGKLGGPPIVVSPSPPTLGDPPDPFMVYPGRPGLPVGTKPSDP
jgi:hypothetical protein